MTLNSPGDSSLETTLQIFGMLSPGIRQTIHEMGWTRFRPIQALAIPAVLTSSTDIVIAAETASGKTEAAFLPIISLIDSQPQEGLAVLYVSPLKALINDQFRRIGDLCARSGIPVNRWHGDVEASQKKRVIESPEGVLQITPESLESLFVNRTQFLRRLFCDLRFIVIDEIHAFVGTERGTHLRSLLSRIRRYTKTRPRMIALSATIGDFDAVRRWIFPEHPESVRIVESKGKERGTRYALFHYEHNGNGFPLKLIEKIYSLTQNYSAIIFCNTRSNVEQMAFDLNRIGKSQGLQNEYLVHHSSIAKELRELTEQRLKTSQGPQSVVATSTLELGIDIGELDLVVQVDSTHSVDSLVQRLGRSGRRENQDRILALFTTKEESLVQSIAVTELYLSGWMESRSSPARPYDVLWHQIISTVCEVNGIKIRELIGLVGKNSAFARIPADRVHALVRAMIQDEYLEFLPGPDEVIVGLKAEHLLRSSEWYAVFSSNDELDVVAGGMPIGTIQIMPSDLKEHETRFLLAGRLWEVVEVDAKRHIVYVQQATSGKPTIWSGSAVPIHHRVRTKMAEILSSDQTFPYLRESGAEILQSLRTERATRKLGVGDRAVVISGNKLHFEAFAGFPVIDTLKAMLLWHSGIHFVQGPFGSLLTSDWNPKLDIEEVVSDLMNSSPNAKEIVNVVPERWLPASKYGVYLPEWARREMYEHHVIHIPETIEFLRNIKLRCEMQG